jgi:hypothetical protein
LLRHASTVCIAVAIADVPEKIEVRLTVTDTFPEGVKHGLREQVISIFGFGSILFVAKLLVIKTSLTAKILAAVNS